MSVRKLQFTAGQVDVGGRAIYFEDSDTVTWEVVSVDDDPSTQDVVRCHAGVGPDAAEIVELASGHGTLTPNSTDEIAITATTSTQCLDYLIAAYSAGNRVRVGVGQEVDLEVFLDNLGTDPKNWKLVIHNTGSSGFTITYRYAVTAIDVP